jgi:hypothetical protein
VGKSIGVRIKNSKYEVLGAYPEDIKMNNWNLGPSLDSSLVSREDTLKVAKEYAKRALTKDFARFFGMSESFCYVKIISKNGDCLFDYFGENFPNETFNPNENE